MTETDRLLENNRTGDYAPGELPGAPSAHIAIVTCMDCRVDVTAALGLKPGEAHIMRNAGGVVSEDMIRSLAISQRKLGTREVMVVHHTRCGMQTFTEDAFRAELLADAGVTPSWAAESFTDLEADVRQSVQRVRNSPFLLHPDAVRGFVYDVDDHTLREVSS